MIVDDEPQACENLRKMLTRKGYAASEAHNGVDALISLQEKVVDIVLLDIRMPVMDGLETLARIKKDHPDIEVLMLTAVNDMETAISCMQKGAYGYLSKPVDITSLLIEMEHALERRKLYLENRQYHENLEIRVMERTQEVQNLYALLDANFSKTVMMFVDLMELRDPFLGGHSKRVALLAERTGRKFSLDERWLRDLEIAGLLHDIGTLGLPENALNVAKDKLSKAESDLLFYQTVLSQETLSSIERLKTPGKIIRSHMEWVDGQGFPDALKDEQIPLESKIIAVSNAYDEVKNRHRFRVEPAGARLSNEERAIFHLKQYAGKHFDRKVVEKFIKTLAEITLEQKGAYAVDLGGLKEGMTLAEDLTTDNGTLLLATGNRLSQPLISKIKNYSALVNPITRKIIVYNDAAYSAASRAPDAT